MTLGKRMVKRREQLGLSQSDLARLVGVPQPRISEFERGVKSDMFLSTALRIARALGVGLDYLAGTFDEEPTPAEAETPPSTRQRPAHS